MVQSKSSREPDANGFVYYTFAAKPDVLEGALRVLATQPERIGLVGSYTPGDPTLLMLQAVTPLPFRCHRCVQAVADEPGCDPFCCDGNLQAAIESIRSGK